MSVLSRLGAKLNQQKSVVGIEILPNGLALAIRSTRTSDLGTVEFLLREGENNSLALSADDIAELLLPFVEKHNLNKSLCDIILPPKDYQLLLVEAPEVPQEELSEAMRWRIKDLISMPVEDVVTDVFTLPEDASRGGKKMVYVVVAELIKIKAIVDAILSVGLNLQSIDIGEFALRNLVAKVDETRGSAVVRVESGQGTLSIYRNGNLYLSRHFKLDYDGGLLTELPVESFSLEVQRSLDYFERQMGQAPPGVMYICGESISEDKVTKELANGLNIPIKFFDIKEILSDSKDISDGVTQLCIGAIGAVYRDEAA